MLRSRREVRRQIRARPHRESANHPVIDDDHKFTSITVSAKRLQLRRPDVCAGCQRALDAGTDAVWDRDARTVTCVRCAEGLREELVRSDPGASALAEASKRRAREAERKRRDIEARPILGRLSHALSPEADAGMSWETGGLAEQKLGAFLDGVPDVVCLHDRRLPRSTANIDHLVVAPTGVWVVDAKRDRGAIKQVDKGGWFRTDLRLTIAGRDRSKLIDGVHKQVDHVLAALTKLLDEPVPARGALCFINGEFSLFARPFTMRDVLITWPRALRNEVGQPGPLHTRRRAEVRSALESSFKPARA
jgi:hypothetical protein